MPSHNDNPLRKAPLTGSGNSAQTIWSWNVNGLRSALRKGAAEDIRLRSPDVLCLQEIRAASGASGATAQELDDYHAFINPAQKPGYAGVAVFTKRTPRRVITNCFGDEQIRSEGRSVLVEFEQFAVLNVYMPHGSRDQSRLPYKLEAYRALVDFVSEWAGPPLILAGDLNIAHESIDLARPINNRRNVMFTAAERAAMDEVLARGGLVDVYRAEHPTTSAYTWWPYLANARARNVGWRIDYLLVGSRLANAVSDVNILSDVFGSDHCPVSVKLDLNNPAGRAEELWHTTE